MQKLHLRNLPSLGDIGGPVEGCTCIVTGPTRSAVILIISMSLSQQASCEMADSTRASYLHLRLLEFAAALAGRLHRHWLGGMPMVSALCPTWVPIYTDRHARPWLCQFYITPADAMYDLLPGTVRW